MKRFTVRSTTRTLITDKNDHSAFTAIIREGGGVMTDVTKRVNARDENENNNSEGPGTRVLSNTLQSTRIATLHATLARVWRLSDRFCL